MNIIEIKDVKKSFKEKEVLKGITFNLKEGEIYGLIGNNGQGKSTLLKIITKLLHKTSGEVIFNNIDLSRVGTSIETPAIYYDLSARENLEAQCLLLGEKFDVIPEILNTVGLEDTKLKTKKFSLGMKQRLAIGMALLNSPKLLILDEPSNGLDPSGVKELKTLLKNLRDKEKISVLISSHIISDIMEISNRVGILKNGIIKGEFKKDELMFVSKAKTKLEFSNSIESIFIKNTLNIEEQDFLIFKNNVYLKEELTEEDIKNINNNLVDNEILNIDTENLNGLDFIISEL